MPRAALTTVLRRLGGAGACDNAYRACEDHRLAMLRIDAVGRRLAPRTRARSPEPARTPTDRPA